MKRPAKGTSQERREVMEWYLMVWKRYAQFSGRSRRKELWMFVLFNTIIGTVLYVGGLVAAAQSSSLSTPLFALYFIYLLAALVPGWAVGARRLHDIDKSGWWQLDCPCSPCGRDHPYRFLGDRWPGGRQPVWPQSKSAGTRRNHRLTNAHIPPLPLPPAPAFVAAGAAAFSAVD